MIRLQMGLRADLDRRGCAILFGAALHLVTGANLARADIAPEGLRGCSESSQGEPCWTDACAQGKCIKIKCKEARPQCDLCLLSAIVADGGACDPECDAPARLVDCLACVPTQGVDLRQPGDPYRWDDCRDRAEGQACR